MTFIAVVLLGTWVGFRLGGAYLFLIYTYGFHRVNSEHLHLVKMGKADPWIVSNGDHLAGGHFLWFLLAAGISTVFSLVMYLLIYKVLPEKSRGIPLNPEG